MSPPLGVKVSFVSIDEEDECHSNTNIGYKYLDDARIVGWVVLSTAVYGRDNAEKGDRGKGRLVVCSSYFLLISAFRTRMVNKET